MLSPAALANSIRDAHHRDPKPHVDRTADAVGRMSGGTAVADTNDLGRAGGRGRHTPIRGADAMEPATAPPFDPVYSAAWHAYLGLADVPVPSSGMPAAPPPEHRGILSLPLQPLDAQAPAPPPSRPSSANSHSTAPADWGRAAAAPPPPGSPVAAATVAAAETWRRSARLSASLPAAPHLADAYGSDGSGMTPRLASPSLTLPQHRQSQPLPQQAPHAGVPQAPAFSEPFPLPLHRSRPAYTAAALADAAGASAAAAYSPADPRGGAASAAAAAGPTRGAAAAAAAAEEWEALLEDLRGLRRGGARETWLHMTAESLRGLRDAYRRAYSTFAADCASPSLGSSPHHPPWNDVGARNEAGSVAAGSAGDRRSSGLLLESPLELAALADPPAHGGSRVRPAPPVSPEAALDAAQRRLLESERARSRALAAQLMAGDGGGAGTGSSGSSSCSSLALLPHANVSPTEAKASWQREDIRPAAPQRQSQQQWGDAAAVAPAAAAVVDSWLAELRRQRFAELDERAQRQRELMQREQGREAWPQRVPLQHSSTLHQHPSPWQQGAQQRPLVPPASAPPAASAHGVSTANGSEIGALAKQPLHSGTADPPLPVAWGSDGYGRLLAEIHAQARADEATAAAVLSVLQPVPSMSDRRAAARPVSGQALTSTGATAAVHTSAGDATGSSSGHWESFVNAL